MQGRKILDGLVVAQEAIYKLGQKGNSGIFLKLDLSKAYDKVSWEILTQILIKLGFREN